MNWNSTTRTKLLKNLQRFVELVVGKSMARDDV
jgi:hypothetical protein